MRIVCGTQSLVAHGGTETYVVTLAAYLERLGHDVWLHAREQGRMAEVARESGLRVAPSLDALPDHADAVVSNLTETAYDLTSRYPDAAHAFVCHSTIFHLALPPQVPGVTPVTIALNDRVAAFVGGLGNTERVVRLHQPVDVDRFAPRRPLSATPQQLLLFGNYAEGERRGMVEEVCRELGIEVAVAGMTGRPTEQPELAINDADIVMGYGRCIVEAMACGRAAYVYDRNGGDGWVTPETYGALEGDGFAGQATSVVITRERLRDDLLKYRPEMGIHNRDLAVGNHQAQMHAAAMADVLADAGSRSDASAAGPDAPWRELARLVRAVAGQEMSVIRLGREVAARAAEVERARAQHERMRVQYHAAQQEVSALRHTVAHHERLQGDVERQARDLRQQADALAEREREVQRRERELTERMNAVDAFRATRRYRLATALARPLDGVRARGRSAR